MLGDLGSHRHRLGEVPKAIEHYQQALEISRDIGDRRGEGNHLGNLGNAYAGLGEMPKAIEHHLQALEISREIGDRRGEGNHLGNLGSAYARLGEVLKAIEHHQQALEISREIGDRRGEAADLGNLGLAYARLGEMPKAMEHYQQALEIFETVGQAPQAMQTRMLLTQILGDQRRWPEAIEICLSAVVHFDDADLVQPFSDLWVKATEAMSRDQFFAIVDAALSRLIASSELRKSTADAIAILIPE